MKIKKIISTMLAGTFLLSVLTVAPLTVGAAEDKAQVVAAAEKESSVGANYNGIEYKIESGKAIVEKYTGNASALTIPTKLGGYPVTCIDCGAFQYNQTLTTVSLPSTLKRICGGAFQYCKKLTSVTIPNSVNVLDYDAFSNCKSLTSAVVGSGVTSMGRSIFSNCSNLKSVKILNGVKEIPEQAFDNCVSLAAVNIPNSIEKIGDGAFWWCESIAEFNIPNSVKTISFGAFERCKNLAKLSIGSSVSEIGASAFCDCNKLTNVVIPNNVQTIRGSAFSDCKNLKTASLGSGIRSMDAYVFSNCTALTVVSISQGAKKIGYDCFSGCTSLTTVTIPDSVTEIGNTKTTSSNLSGDWAFYNHPASLTIYGKVGSFAERYAKANNIKFLQSLSKANITSLTYNGNNTLKINAVPGANKYQIARLKSGDKAYTYFYTTSTTFTEKNVVGGIAYTYQVRAMYQTANSGTSYGAWSASKSVPTLVAPTVTLANKSNGIRVTWNSIRGAKKYIVYYKKSTDKNWSSASTTNTYYPILNVQRGATYYVQVRPVGATVSKPYSSVKSIVFK